MDFKGIAKKVSSVITKYKYAAVVLLVGIALLIVPNRKESATETGNYQPKSVKEPDTTELADILEAISGAGKVKVMLSVASGEKTIYQSDSDIVTDGDSTATKSETIIVTDSQKAQTGLVSQINPPVYLGAIVVCEGADNPTVRLSVTQAVSKITGLGTNNICVVKMES